MNPDSVAADECLALNEPQVVKSFPLRNTSLGHLEILRALPIREKRMIGPWCFLDRYGPHHFAAGKAMDVAPHPHIGLQTITWLLDGEILHNDSLGYEALIRPGRVNVMTSGKGIAHSEETPADNSGRLNGVQLWTALPQAQRDMNPAFQQVEEVPTVELSGGSARVFAGTLADTTSPAQFYSDIIGAELNLPPAAALSLPLKPAREHGLLLLAGDLEMAGEPLNRQNLSYLGTSRTAIDFNSRKGARLLLIGGEPFPEAILMWWNFVARTPEEMIAARNRWEQGEGFGEVKAYKGQRLSAPPLTRLARPNPAS